jgi:hypothetical protein
LDIIRPVALRAERRDVEVRLEGRALFPEDDTMAPRPLVRLVDRGGGFAPLERSPSWLLDGRAIGLDLPASALQEAVGPIAVTVGLGPTKAVRAPRDIDIVEGLTLSHLDPSEAEASTFLSLEGTGFGRVPSAVQVLAESDAGLLELPVSSMNDQEIHVSLPATVTASEQWEVWVERLDMPATSERRTLRIASAESPSPRACELSRRRCERSDECRDANSGDDCERAVCRLERDGGDKVCCLRPPDRCTSNEDCCGPMICGPDNRCECRSSGESCLGSAQCCGASLCNNGRCS